MMRFLTQSIKKCVTKIEQHFFTYLLQRIKHQNKPIWKHQNRPIWNWWSNIVCGCQCQWWLWRKVCKVWGRRRWAVVGIKSLENVIVGIVGDISPDGPDPPPFLSRRNMNQTSADGLGWFTDNHGPILGWEAWNQSMYQQFSFSEFCVVYQSVNSSRHSFWCKLASGSFKCF